MVSFTSPLIGLTKHKKLFSDIFLLSTFFPMIQAVKENTFNPTDVLQKEECRRKLYFLENYIKDAKILLSRFEENGYLQ